MGEHVIYGDLSHITIFLPSSLRQMLRWIGFQDITIRECPPAPGTLGGRIRARVWRTIAASVGLLYRIGTGKKESIWTESMLSVCSKSDSRLAREPAHGGG
jgi:hypothetical protein